MHKLIIDKLCVSINNKSILKDFSLEIKSGEIHAIMGPNGVGKSTLSKVILGDPNFIITSGKIIFDDIELNEMSTDERARLGLFLGMQNPLEIEGVSNAEFLRTALHTKENNKTGLYQFVKKMEQAMDELKMPKEMMHRSINMGFSGGERKRNEILQLKILEPKMIILDEIDSGLDIDSLKIVGENVLDYFKKKDCGILFITHHSSLFKYIKPHFVHIMIDGKIEKTGDLKLGLEIEESGYNNIKKEKKSNSIGTCIVRENLKSE